MEKTTDKFEKYSPLKTILLCSLPSSLGAIIGMLCVLTDRYFIGQVAERNGMAAIALVFPYIMIINSFTFSFSGISILVGIKLGEKNFKEANKIFNAGFFSIFVVGILLSIFLWYFNTPILRLFGATDETIIFAKEYTSYIIPIATSQILLGQTTLIRGVGDFNTSLVINIITGVTNAILDYIFMIHFNMGIKGASLATFIATTISATYVIFYFFKSNIITFSRKYFKWNFDIFKEIFKVGSPRFFNQIFQASMITVTNREAGLYGGAIATSAIGIISVYRSLVNTSLQGFNQGTSAILSYNFGAKNITKMKQIFSLQLIIVFFTSLSLVIFMFIFSDNIVSFFVKNDRELISFTSKAMKINLALMPLTAIFIACNNFFQAIKENKIASRFFVLRILILNIPLVFILGSIFKLLGVWLAFPLSDTTVAILISILTIKKFRFLEKTVKKS